MGWCGDLGRVSQVAGGGVGLTFAQMKVLDGITKGLTNREIADVLEVNVKRIQWHAEHAYRKIGVG